MLALPISQSSSFEFSLKKIAQPFHPANIHAQLRWAREIKFIFPFT